MPSNSGTGCASSIVLRPLPKALTIPLTQIVPLLVEVEATGEKPREWAWAIYRDVDRTLIARSRALYWSQGEAEEAGGDAAATVKRNLQLRAPRAIRSRSGVV